MKCSAKWMKDWHYVQCSREAKLEHEGKPYCAQHHPPSKQARQEKAQKCAYIYTYLGRDNRCETKVQDGAKYCKFHSSSPVPTDELAELRADKKRMDWLTAMTEGVQKVYIEPAGWIYLDRNSIDVEMSKADV